MISMNKKDYSALVQMVKSLAADAENGINQAENGLNSNNAEFYRNMKARYRGEKFAYETVLSMLKDEVFFDQMREMYTDD